MYSVLFAGRNSPRVVNRNYLYDIVSIGKVFKYRERPVRATFWPRRTVISSQAASAVEANARIDVDTSPLASDYHTFPFLPRLVFFHLSSYGRFDAKLTYGNVESFVAIT